MMGVCLVPRSASQFTYQCIINAYRSIQTQDKGCVGHIFLHCCTEITDPSKSLWQTSLCLWVMNLAVDLNPEVYFRYLLLTAS